MYALLFCCIIGASLPTAYICTKDGSNSQFCKVLSKVNVFVLLPFLEDRSLPIIFYYNYSVFLVTFFSIKLDWRIANQKLQEYLPNQIGNQAKRKQYFSLNGYFFFVHLLTNPVSEMSLTKQI